MADAISVRNGASLLLIGLVAAALAAAGRAEGPPQDEARTCFVCHADSEAESSAGTPIFVDPDVFGASVHAAAGLGCVGCHADLAGVEDFPHAVSLAAVDCARCHPAYGRDSVAAVHAVLSPRLAARPVHCKDCHGYHDVRPSSEPGSRAHSARLPATCGACHPGAGPNFARGRVHDLAGDPRRSPADIVRAVYRVAIAITVALCFAYIAVDLIRRKGER
jgi:hypothetical protein